MQSLVDIQIKTIIPPKNVAHLRLILQGEAHSAQASQASAGGKIRESLC